MINTNTVSTPQSNWPIASQYPIENVKEAEESGEIHPEKNEDLNAALPDFDQYIEPGGQPKESPGLYIYQAQRQEILRAGNA